MNVSREFCKHGKGGSVQRILLSVSPHANCIKHDSTERPGSRRRGTAVLLCAGCCWNNGHYNPVIFN